MTKRRVVELEDGTYTVQYRVQDRWRNHVEAGTRDDAIRLYESLAQADAREEASKKIKVSRVVYP